MLSQFEIILKPLDPNCSFLGTSLLAFTLTFGEADVIATEQNFSPKLVVNIFSTISAFDVYIFQLSLVSSFPDCIATLFGHCSTW